MPKRLTELSDGPHLYKYIRARVTGPNRKSGSRVCYRHFDSVSDKYVELMSECCNGELRGGPTFELFRLGGNKKIIWVDIDTNDWDAFRLWEGSSSFPFPTDSYRAVESGSGNIHLYVVVDRVLVESHCQKLKDHIKDLMPPVLAGALDRIYGPNQPTTVYIPLAHTGNPVLPQDLVKDCQAVYKTSNDIIGKTLWERFIASRRNNR